MITFRDIIYTTIVKSNMAKYSEAQKASIYKWVNNNREKYDTYQRLKEKIWRINNPDKYVAKKKRKQETFLWKKVSKIYCQILLE